MERPDWKIAPEGTTHFDPQDRGKPYQWIKKADGYWFTWTASGVWEVWEPHISVQERLIPRPVEPDWLNAPEYATHWDPEFCGKPRQWVKCDADDNSWYAWTGCTWVPAWATLNFLKRLVQRPNETSFLPEYGEEVEAKDYRRGWIKGKYIAYDQDAQIHIVRTKHGYCGYNLIRLARTDEQHIMDELADVVRSIQHKSHSDIAKSVVEKYIELMGGKLK